MNYYPQMSHHMFEQPPYHRPPQMSQQPPTNRFIYVKQNFLNPTPKVLINPNPAPNVQIKLNPAPKVLVNPHFKKKVYINPQFNPNLQKVPSKPTIHVNPKMLTSFASKPQTPTKSTVISTRNKLLRVPISPDNKVTRKRRDSLHTKYKIVRSSPGAKKSPLNNNNSNKFKLDKRVGKNVNQVRTVRKRYVYVNRFLSMDVVAKNVLLKKNSNLNRPGFVNINGILYKKSPNSLKKAPDSSLIKSSKYKIVRKDANATPQKKTTSRRSLVKRHTIIRARKLSPSKLKKCNVPCPVYRKFGKCKGKDNGTCIKLHNPNQIVLCTRFLQGACLNENCLLSHKVSLEKMPTCKYFLLGLCSKDNCPYLHVKISPKAEICKDFLEGFCKLGAQCDKRHQFLCPDFEKAKKCPRRRCPYPHGNLVRQSKVLTKLVKKCSAKKQRAKILIEAHEKERYYKDKAPESQLDQSIIETVSKNRPKLGELPAFIPFFDAT